MMARVLKHQAVGWTYNIMSILMVGGASGLGLYHVFSFRRFLHAKKYI